MMVAEEVVCRQHQIGIYIRELRFRPQHSQLIQRCGISIVIAGHSTQFTTGALHTPTLDVLPLELTLRIHVV